MINWVPLDGLLKNKDARCIYCGERSEVHDHLIPLCFLETRARKSGSRYLRADSCKECNGLIYSRFFDSLDDRIAHVADRLRDVNAKLVVGNWTVAELSGMGYALRDHIKQQIALKERSNRRSAWTFTPDYVELRNDLEQQCKDHWPNNTQLLSFIAPKWSSWHNLNAKTS